MDEMEFSRIKKAVANARRGLLDILELYLKDDPNWELIRKKIFQCFGNNGLDGAIDDLFNKK